MTGSSSAPTAELFVRSLAPHGARQRQERIVERLDVLVDSGVLQDWQLRIWGEAVRPDGPTSRTETARFVLGRVAAFREWADAAGVSLDPFLVEQTVDCVFTDEHCRVVSLPALALAEYEDGTLRHVAPHTTDDGQCTVIERLDTLPDTDDRSMIPVETNGTDPSTAHR